MTSMNRWMGVVTAAAFLAAMVPSLAYARGADDLKPHLPKPQKPERPHKPHFAARGGAAPAPKPVNPKQQFGKGGKLAARGGAAPAPKPANPNQQKGKPTLA